MPRAAPSSTADNPLARYWAKRDFSATAEPRGEHAPRSVERSFVIQKHAASRLHYDFRLELDGVLVSWAVPKGPSYDPALKRLAVHVEDHPLSYGGFEGTIPKGHYGAGTVIVWDQGTWAPVGDAAEGLRKGKLVFHLFGQKMAGLWELVRSSRGEQQRQEQWLLFKKRDEFARPHADYDVVAALPDSVIAKPLPTTRARQASKADAGVPGAVKAALPDALSPQLATLATGVPATGDWIYEIKFDGYRMLARIDKGRARLFTRNGHDWSAKMPALIQALEQLGLKSGWLDGEVVVLDDAGLPSFSALQKAFDAQRDATFSYFLFDLPFIGGYDLRQVALRHRRTLLRGLLEGVAGEALRLSEEFEAAPATLLTSACNMNLEGVIAKQADAAYVSTRSETWLKLKCKRRQEFVVCGYTERSDGSPQVGSLLLGVHDEAGRLLSVGSVGTGWDAKEARALKKKLAKLQRPQAPFDAWPAKKGRWSRRAAGAERWVEPILVAEVSFAAWTADGQIRHASYVSLRDDKPASAILRETPQEVGTSSKPRAKPAAAASIRLTHGERVIDASTGLTKLDLLRYYESISDWLLPHLKGRPVSLVRGPTGVDGELFFQKHGEKIGIPGIKELDPQLWPGHEALLVIDTPQALLAAAQMNVMELHTWNSVAKKIDVPDRMVFDLDPGEGVAWPQVQEAALLLRSLLTELGLESWLKTSGGKGLHMVVPLAPRHEDDTVKAFSKAIVQHLARTIPSRFVAKSGPSNRIGRIFVDYLRNGHGATTAAAFSARARPGLGVSMPVDWQSLPTLKGGAHWTIANAREHLSFQKTDPWADYWTSKQALKTAMARLGFEPPG
jgi:bifunctional non-homologous end joining protein LigD